MCEIGGKVYRNFEGEYCMNERNLVIYLQCDVRYNDYLLQKIQGETVVEHTVNRIKLFYGWTKIIASLYDCAENRTLGELLSDAGIEVQYSDEEQVTKRFIEAVINCEKKYVVRVAGDQLLFHGELMNEIIDTVEVGDYEFFYAQSSINAIIGDMVQISTLKRHYNKIMQAGRYFHPLCREKNIRRYSPRLPELFYPCRANSEDGLVFASKVIEKNLDVLDLSNALIEKLQSDASDLKKTGILRSWLLRSIGDFFYDVDGFVNPWWCESAVNRVKDRIRQTLDIRVFEWGAGNSTLFWTRYAKEIVSVEHDRDWYEKMKGLVPREVRIEYRELEYGGDYCQVILGEPEKFDIVLIDGRDRVRCAKNCVDKIKENGIIIWDNTDREYYEEGYQYLKSRGFKQLELSGIIWGLPGVRDYTSFFYRNDNIWGL